MMNIRKLASQVIRGLHESNKNSEPVNTKCIVTINPTPAGIEPFILFNGDYEDENFDGEQTSTSVINNTFDAVAGVYTIALISSAVYVDLMQAFTITNGDVTTGTKTIDVTLEAK